MNSNSKLWRMQTNIRIKTSNRMRTSTQARQMWCLARLDSTIVNWSVIKMELQRQLHVMAEFKLSLIQQLVAKERHLGFLIMEDTQATQEERFLLSIMQRSATVHKEHTLQVEEEIETVLRSSCSTMHHRKFKNPITLIPKNKAHWIQTGIVLLYWNSKNR